MVVGIFLLILQRQHNLATNDSSAAVERQPMAGWMEAQNLSPPTAVEPNRWLHCQGWIRPSSNWLHKGGFKLNNHYPNAIPHKASNKIRQSNRFLSNMQFKVIVKYVYSWLELPSKKKYVLSLRCLAKAAPPLWLDSGIYVAYAGWCLEQNYLIDPTKAT